MWGSIRRCTAHKQFRLKVRQRRPKSLEKAVAFASEVEAMEQTEYCKHTRAVHVNNPPKVLTVNNDETNQILKRSHYIIEQNKPSFERIKCLQHGKSSEWILHVVVVKILSETWNRK